jgi:hypothetical protein
MLKFDMEELLQHPIITLSLGSSFNPFHWQQITTSPPAVYQTQMETIYRFLGQSLPHLSTHYHQFVQNHLTIRMWFKTNHRHQHLIEPYLFDPSPQALAAEAKKPAQVARLRRTEPNAVRRYFAESVKPPNLSLTTEIEPNDNYELFMQTFRACRGNKYIPYDYEKHMKSCREKSKYNNFIRSNHKRNVSNPIKKEHFL